MATSYFIAIVMIVTVFALQIQAQETETVTGTIYCDNNFTFYINGEFVTQDPVAIIPHNAHNFTFLIPKGEDVTFAITAIDWANETTGLEYDNRCVGDGVCAPCSVMALSPIPRGNAGLRSTAPSTGGNATLPLTATTASNFFQPANRRVSLPWRVVMRG